MNGHTKVDPATVNTTVEVLKTNQSLSLWVLRPLFKNTLQSIMHISEQHVHNFRRHVVLYCMRNKDASMLIGIDSRSLTRFPAKCGV